MKIKLISEITMATGIFLLVAACGTSKEKSPSKSKGIPLMPEILGASISKDIVSNDGKDTIESTLDYQFYSAPKFPWQDSVNYKIGHFVWSTIEYNEIPYQHAPLSHQYFYDRLDGFEKMYKAYEQESEYSTIWNYEGGCAIENNLKDYVQLSQHAYMFTGGAHPNSVYVWSVISKKDGTTLLLKDVVKDVAQFNRIAEKYFRISRELSPDENLSDDFWFENKTFACNNNFSISPEGITFMFNAYEIAPYVFGTTEFTVPMSEIKGLLAIELLFE